MAAAKAAEHLIKAAPHDRNQRGPRARDRNHRGLRLRRPNQWSPRSNRRLNQRPDENFMRKALSVLALLVVLLAAQLQTSVAQKGDSARLTNEVSAISAGADSKA